MLNGPSWPLPGVPGSIHMTIIAYAIKVYVYLNNTYRKVPGNSASFFYVLSQDGGVFSVANQEGSVQGVCKFQFSRGCHAQVAKNKFFGQESCSTFVHFASAISPLCWLVSRYMLAQPLTSVWVWMYVHTCIEIQVRCRRVTSTLTIVAADSTGDTDSCPERLIVL
ncbi:hypothetical protein F5B20DRAFT_547816 [Whalleya microplaca]|nr:hypothetical protein F5B20DRAFT_547816 [Whalleya microplaca]